MGWLERTKAIVLPKLGLEKEKELSLWVSGIKCDKCVARIEDNLRQLQFVRQARVTSKDPGRVHLVISEDAPLEGVQATLHSILANDGYILSKMLIET